MSLYKTLFMDEQDYWLSSNYELIETVLYSVVCFLVPFMLGNSQLITGIIVNAALVLAAMNIRNEKLLPVIMLPSLAVLSRGLIFGPLTMYLIYLIPFIWLGNFVLVYLVKKLFLGTNASRWLTLGIGSAAKAALIFAGAFALFRFSLIPQALLIPMSLIQLATAVGGGIIAFGTQHLKKKLFFGNL